MPLTTVRTSSRLGRAQTVGPRFGGNRVEEPETLDYANAIAAAGGSISAGDLAAIDGFVRGLKLDGVWPLLDLVWPCAGDQLAAALVCLKVPLGTSRTLTNTAFVAADYNTSRGLTGDGSTKQLAIALNLSVTQTASSTVHLSAYLTAGEYSTGIVIGNTTGSTYLQSGNCTTSLAGGSTVSNPTSPRWPGRFFGTILSSYVGGVTSLYRRAQLINSAATTFTSLPTTVGVFSNGAGSFRSASTLALATAGAGLNAAQITALDVRCDMLVAALGRKPSEPIVLTNPTVLVRIGQSLARGVNTLPTTLTQQFNNLGLDYPCDEWDRVGSGTVRFAPLVETNSTLDVGNGGETPNSGLTNSLSTVRPDLTCFVCGYVKGGTDYAAMAKGTAGYAAVIGQVTFAHARFAGMSRTDTVAAVVCTHGESDGLNTSYDANLVQWQSDYETNLKAATGQSSAIPLVFSQAHSWTSFNSSRVPIGQYRQYLAWKNNPTKLIICCPKYMLPYSDSLAHLTVAGSRWLGVMEAKAINTILGGSTPAPLAPISVTRSGTLVTAVFNKGGLVVDTTIVADPSATYANSTSFGGTTTTVTNYKGFEFVDDTAAAPSASILSHVISTTNIANDTLVFTLSGVPTGANPRLRYAWTMTLANAPGPTTGPRGNLRDADTSFVDTVYGNTTYNWCVTFDEAVN